MSYHNIYHIITYIISYHITSHILSYHIISYHIISYHIISYHIISYHIGKCFNESYRLQNNSNAQGPRSQRKCTFKVMYTTTPYKYWNIHENVSRCDHKKGVTSDTNQHMLEKIDLRSLTRIPPDCIIIPNVPSTTPLWTHDVIITSF